MVNLDLLVRCGEKVPKTIPTKWWFINGDESHGRINLKESPTKQTKEDHVLFSFGVGTSDVPRILNIKTSMGTYNLHFSLSDNPYLKS